MIPGFYILRFVIRKDGSRIFEGITFPQGYNEYMCGFPLPYKNREDALSGIELILKEGIPNNRELEVYNSQDTEKEINDSLLRPHERKKNNIPNT